MAEGQTGRPEINEAAIKAAWGKFAERLRIYPAATVAQRERLKMLPDLAGSFAEFRRAGGEVTGERAAQMEVAAGAGVIEVVEMDTNLAVDDLQVGLEKPEVMGDPTQAAIYRQTLNQVLELREGIGDHVGVARREEFTRKTENVKKWLGGGGRAGEVMREMERGVEPTQAELEARWNRVKSLEAVANLGDQQLEQLTKDVAVVFAARGMKWPAQEVQVMVFLEQRFDLVKRGLGRLEDIIMRDGSKDMLRLYWSFVFALPRKNLSGQQQDVLKRAYEAIEKRRGEI